MGGGKASDQKRFSTQENREVANGSFTFCPGKDGKLFECGKDKDDQISQRDKVDEITKLQELNQELVNQITSLRQKNEDDRHLWDSERRKLEGIVAELQSQLDLTSREKGLLSQKNTKLSTEAESLNAQINVLKYELNESKGRTGALLGKIEEGQHLWDEEKRKMENNLAELQTNIELMSRERGSLSQKNKELGTEVEFLKVQVNEYNDTVICMDDERQLLKEMLSSDAERLEDLLAKNATMEDKINQLEQLSQKNRELSTEVEFLKVQVNEYNDTVICMEDDRQLLKEMLSSEAERLQDLLTKNARMEDKINQLEQQNKILQEKAGR